MAQQQVTDPDDLSVEEAPQDGNEIPKPGCAKGCINWVLRKALQIVGCLILSLIVLLIALLLALYLGKGALNDPVAVGTPIPKATTSNLMLTAEVNATASALPEAGADNCPTTISPGETVVVSASCGVQRVTLEGIPDTGIFSLRFEGGVLVPSVGNFIEGCGYFLFDASTFDGRNFNVNGGGILTLTQIDEGVNSWDTRPCE